VFVGVDFMIPGPFDYDNEHAMPLGGIHCHYDGRLLGRKLQPYQYIV
jgi:hypothetical protein